MSNTDRFPLKGHIYCAFLLSFKRSQKTDTGGKYLLLQRIIMIENATTNKTSK